MLLIVVAPRNIHDTTGNIDRAINATSVSECGIGTIGFQTIT
eukprot:UN08031